MIAHIQRRFELLRNGLDYNRELSDTIQTKIYKLDNLNTYLCIDNYKMNAGCFVKGVIV